MTEAVSASVPLLVLFGALWFMLAQRKAADTAYEALLGVLVEAHGRERQAWTTQRAELLEHQETDRLQWRRERGELLNRIKPETAQYQPVDGQVPPQPHAVRFDDDEDGWSALGLSREELADALAAQELAER